MKKNDYLTLDDREVGKGRREQTILNLQFIEFHAWK